MIRIRTYGKEKTVENIATLRRLVERGRLDAKDEAYNPLEDDWVPLRYVIEDAEDDPQLEALLNQNPDAIAKVQAEPLSRKEIDAASIQAELEAYMNAAGQKDYTAPQPAQRKNSLAVKKRQHKQRQVQTVPPQQTAQVQGAFRNKTAAQKPAPQQLFFWQSSAVIILALIFFAPLGIILLLMRPRVGLLGNPLVKVILILGFAWYWISQYLPQDAEAMTSVAGI